MVDFATLDRDETHLYQSGTERLMSNLSLPKPHQEDTHDRTTREAVQANKRATASDWTVVGRRSVPKPVGRRSVPHPDGRRSVPTPIGWRSVPHPDGRRSVPTPVGRRSGPHPDPGGRRSVPNVRHTPGQCTRCGESNHVTATCRHAQKVVCRTCLKSGHKD